MPIGQHYVNISKFVASNDQFDLGLVSHALCAAIGTILKVGLLYIMMKCSFVYLFVRIT